MIYDKIITGKFVSRPNRFIAYVEIDQEIEKVHVKNTGRCKELLVPGVTVILEDCSHIATRKTRYSLIAVYKASHLINMDSQVPNKVVAQALENKKISGLEDISNLKMEKTYKNSRFDLYFEKDNKPSFMEIKGVTLEKDGIAMFPDAPTKRGSKHIHELIEAKKNGYNSYLFFLIQMDYVHSFKPNEKMDPDFYKALVQAHSKGVEILAYTSRITTNSIELLDEIRLSFK